MGRTAPQHHGQGHCGPCPRWLRPGDGGGVGGNSLDTPRRQSQQNLPMDGLCVWEKEVVRATQGFGLRLGRKEGGLQRPAGLWVRAGAEESSGTRSSLEKHRWSWVNGGSSVRWDRGAECAGSHPLGLAVSSVPRWQPDCCTRPDISPPPPPHPLPQALPLLCLQRALWAGTQGRRLHAPTVLGR